MEIEQTFSEKKISWLWWLTVEHTFLQSWIGREWDSILLSLVEELFDG